MSSIATSLGLRNNDSSLLPPPSLAASYIIFHFLFAYGVLSSRTWKQYYGFDHNVSPREDLVKYGEKAVQDGKITRAKLNQIKRVESCHANSVEHFAVFAVAMIWAQMAGVPNVVINGSGLAYTMFRLCYSAVYIFVDTPMWSQLRGISWWASNVVCMRLLWLGGSAVNAKQ